MKGILWVPHISLNEHHVFEIKQEKKEDLNIVVKTKFNKEDFNTIQEISYDVDSFVFQQMRNERVQYEGKVFNVDGKINKNTMLENLVYYPCVINLLDLNGKDEKIDNLLFYYNQQEPFGVTIEFNPFDIPTEAEIELKSWMTSSMSIYNTIEKYNLNDDNTTKLLLNLPKRTFKFHLNDKANCYLEDCKIIEKIENNKFIILVNKIIFYIK